MADVKSITLNDQILNIKDEVARNMVQDAEDNIAANSVSINYLRNVVTDAAADVQTLKNNDADQNTALETLKNRIDNLVTSPTPGDAELVDIRTGANGIIYASAGDAVRGQYTQLEEQLMTINITQNKEINTSALWEVGAIDSATGNNAVSSSRLRTKYYLADNISWFDLEDDTRGCFIYGYDRLDNFVGVWTTDGNWVTDGTGNGFTAYCLQDIYDRYPNYHFRLSVYARSGADPTIYESSSYRLYNGLSNYGEPKKIRVLQYNIGKYNMGLSGGLADNVQTKIKNYKDFFGSQSLDFLCLQEDTEYIDADEIYTSDGTLYDYLYEYSSHWEREKVIKSNYLLYNSTQAYIHPQSGDPPSDIIYCDTRINNKPVRIVTGVLNVTAPINQKLQSVDKFINLMSGKHNVIACFDTNVLSAVEAVQIQNRFAAGGFSSANWDYFGFKNTYNLNIDMYHAIDNVFVKGGIKITNIEVPDVYNTLSSDHYPVIVELSVL